MTESSKWMVLVTVLAIGAVVYDAKFRTTYVAETTNEQHVKVFQGNKVRMCQVSVIGGYQSPWKWRWNKASHASCTNWLPLKTRYAE